MKPTSEILERIEKCSSEHKDGVFTRLYRYLLREDIYYAAYQKLYANKGATAQGIDNDTADGFSDFYVKELIQSLKDGTYKANPVRREYIPKKNGKLRPLGIPSFRDKLLQEVVRMILEAIYEPVFDSHSHGFRPGKSCHTALRQISSDFTGVVWFIEGDIQGCFDNINHEKLIEILSRKIKDSRFLNIIRQFLKAGYIENWKYNATYSGSPQGGICSPILANIYLNELDKKFREIAELFDKPRSAYQTLEYHAASKELKRLSYWIDHTSDEAARQELIDQHRAQKKAMRNLPCKPADNKKFTFVRYDSISVDGQAADWVEVLAVFAVKVAGSDDVDAADVATMDANRIARLKAVFWDMTAIANHVEVIHHPSGGEEDNGWTERNLYITITAKTAEEMKTVYHFNRNQVAALEELLEQRDLLLELIEDVYSVSGDTAVLIRSLPKNLSPEREAVVRTACSLVGKVNYFWGGKSLVIGWDARWGELRQVTAAGSSTTGTYRPYGVDCSGFVDWVFYNATNGSYIIGHGGGATMQHSYCTDISWEDAQPGDLAFYPDNSHVGIVGGRDANGELFIIHCASGYNNVVITGKEGFASIGRPQYYSD